MAPRWLLLFVLAASTRTGGLNAQPLELTWLEKEMLAHGREWEHAQLRWEGWEGASGPPDADGLSANLHGGTPPHEPAATAAEAAARPLAATVSVKSNRSSSWHSRSLQTPGDEHTGAQGLRQYQSPAVPAAAGRALRNSDHQLPVPVVSTDPDHPLGGTPGKGFRCGGCGGPQRI
jgi:hypothetical protein